jgi:hypothetical protein
MKRETSINQRPKCTNCSESDFKLTLWSAWKQRKYNGQLGTKDVFRDDSG